MFNFIRQGFTVKGTMAFAMASVLLTLSHSCWAAECRMNNGKGGTTTLINSEYSGLRDPLIISPKRNHV